MSEKWIEHNLLEQFDWRKAIEIKENHDVYLTGVSKSGNKIEILKLSKDLKHIKKLNL